MATPQSRYPLLAILGLALLLRVMLALQGGQFFFPDEGRILRGVLLYRGITTGNGHLVTQALATSQHTAFPFATALIAAPAHGLAWLAGTGDWSQATQVRAAGPLLALFLALFSVANVWLVHRLVRAHSGTAQEADWAALLAAISAPLLTYSRHLLPYDCALTAALAGLLAAAGPRLLRRSLLAGAAAGICVALYNGYWFLAPVIIAATMTREASWRENTRAAALAGFSASAALGLLMVPAALAQRGEFWRELAAFGGSVTQGLFAEGWSLPGEYLWHTEGWLGVGMVAAVIAAWLRRDFVSARVRLWLGLAGLTYALLVLGSVVLEKFVVYGRSARVLGVFLCLLGGGAVERLLGRHPRVRPAAIGLILGLGALTLAPHFRVTFPHEATLAVWSDYGVPKLAASFSGLSPDPLWPAVTRPELALVNALPLYPLRAVAPPPDGKVLAEWRHPNALPAYQYEGHTPRERRLLRAHPPSLQLLALTNPAQVPDQPPVEFFLTKEEQADGYDHRRGR